MRLEHCPACNHELYKEPLGPCTWALNVQINGKSFGSKCGCTHVSHYTNHVEMVKE